MIKILIPTSINTSTICGWYNVKALSHSIYTGIRPRLNSATSLKLQDPAIYGQSSLLVNRIFTWIYLLNAIVLLGCLFILHIKKLICKEEFYNEILSCRSTGFVLTPVSYSVWSGHNAF